MKEQLSKNLKLFPAKGAKIGEKWTTSEDIDPSGKLKQTLTFTLLKVEDGKAEIDVKGTRWLIPQPVKI